MMKTKTILTALLAAMTFGVQAQDLIYQFDWDDNGGSGTTVNDVSGFGTADNATAYDSTTATANFVASTGATASPDGGFYGNFATDDRRSISDFGTKWNDDANGISVNNGSVTVTMLLRDVNLSGGTGRDGAFFRTDNDGSGFHFAPASTASNNQALELNMAGTSATTTATADLSNSSGNGWNLLAFSYSADSNTGKVYLGRDYNSVTGAWGSFGQVGSDLSIASAAIPNMDLASSTRSGFGTSSGDSQQFNGDDFRIYNGVLDGSTIENLHVIPEPGTLVLVGIALGSLFFFRSRK